MKQNDSVVLDIVNKLEIVAPLNPRDAFCGGRTNAVKLYHQTEADEDIGYYDAVPLREQKPRLPDRAPRNYL